MDTFMQLKLIQKTIIGWDSKLSSGEMSISLSLSLSLALSLSKYQSVGLVNRGVCATFEAKPHLERSVMIELTVISCFAQEVQAEPVLDALKDTKKHRKGKSLPFAHLPILQHQEHTRSKSNPNPSTPGVTLTLAHQE